MHVIVDAFWQGRNRFRNKKVGAYFDDLKKPKAACHLGAVYYGTFKKTASNVSALIEMYPELHKMVKLPCAPCNDTAETEGTISAIMIHLSDSHDKRSWPDEKIASWLETVLSDDTVQAL